MPNVCATRDGKTPKRKPYASPVSPATRVSLCGSEIAEPASWVIVNTTEEANRHQKRERLSFLTITSEPIPIE